MVRMKETVQMTIVAPTLDDLLNQLYRELIRAPRMSATKGSFTEITAAHLRLTNPRARLSNSQTRGRLISTLGEFLWYMAGSSSTSFINHYLHHYNKESQFVQGAYGPRLHDWRGTNQLQNVIDILNKRPTSRQAVIQLYDCTDAGAPDDVPCTCVLQFLIRGENVNMITFMRSNDAYKGLPHDIFSFTMLQEYIAATLKLELGYYDHFVGSLHLYDADHTFAEQFLNEGYQTSNFQMPPMPIHRVKESLAELLVLEESLRVDLDSLESRLQDLNNYWRDLALLLVHYNARKSNNSTAKSYVLNSFGNRHPFTPFLQQS